MLHRIARHALDLFYRHYFAVGAYELSLLGERLFHKNKPVLYRVYPVVLYIANDARNLDAVFFCVDLGNVAAVRGTFAVVRSIPAKIRKRAIECVKIAHELNESPCVIRLLSFAVTRRNKRVSANDC